MRTLNRILYVDDEADIREIVAMSLEMLDGVSVYTCASGKEALEQLPGLLPDMVLLDVMMPGLDGPSTLKALRSHRVFEDTPVVFVTAKAMPDEVSRFRALGAAGVIAKPFDPMRLASQVRAIWDEQGRHADALRSKLASTRLRFLDRTRVDVERMRTLVGTMSSRDPAAYVEVRHIAHRIHGSGAVFGFPQVSEAAARFEEILEGVADTAMPARSEILAQCDLLADALTRDLRDESSAVAATT